MATPTPRLCFVSDTWAYFTSCPLDKQWGGDWGDSPYEHNAGTPYEWGDWMRERGIEPYSIVKIAWDGPFERPGAWETNSHYSVQDINSGAVPWLAPCKFDHDHGVRIMAGTTLADFIGDVERAGGHVWLPMDMPRPINQHYTISVHGTELHEYPAPKGTW